MSSSAGVSQKTDSRADAANPSAQTDQLTTIAIDPAQAEAALSSAPIIAYFASPQGHEVLTRILTILENLKRATIDTTVDQQKRALEFQHATWRFWMWAQIGLVLAAIGTAGILAWHGRLDGGIGTLIGTLVGYVFGKNKT